MLAPLAFATLLQTAPSTEGPALASVFVSLARIAPKDSVNDETFVAGFGDDGRVLWRAHYADRFVEPGSKDPAPAMWRSLVATLIELDDVDGDDVRDFALAGGWLRAAHDDRGAHEGWNVIGVSGRDGSVLWDLRGGKSIEGPVADLGACAIVVEDRDGDGLADLAIGEPHVVSAADRTGSRVFIVRSADGTILRRLGPHADFTGFGHALAETRDLDGDGAADLAVGAPYAGRGAVAIIGSRSVEPLAICREEDGQEFGVNLFFCVRRSGAQAHNDLLLASGRIAERLWSLDPHGFVVELSLQPGNLEFVRDLLPELLPGREPDWPGCRRTFFVPLADIDRDGNADFAVVGHHRVSSVEVCDSTAVFSATGLDRLDARFDAGFLRGAAPPRTTWDRDGDGVADLVRSEGAIVPSGETLHFESIWSSRSGTKLCEYRLPLP